MSNATLTTPWLTSPPNPTNRLHLFCFPYAGGGASMYRTWSQDLPTYISTTAIQFPGRETRIQEEPYTHFTRAITDLTDALIPHLNRPYAFYGHSMGALIAFEVARELRRRNASIPHHLFIGGRGAPQLQHPVPASTHLSDPELIAELQAINGVPAVVANDPQMAAIAVRTIRADLTLLEDYHYQDEPPLDCPISAFGGWQDSLVSHDSLSAWSAQTRKRFHIHQFPGDHFFLKPFQAELLQSMLRLL